MCLFKNHFQKNENIYSLNVDVVNIKWKFIYLGRRPSPSPLLSPDVLADIDVVDLSYLIYAIYLPHALYAKLTELHTSFSFCVPPKICSF
jgi:hypothetical protein